MLEGGNSLSARLARPWWRMARKLASQTRPEQPRDTVGDAMRNADRFLSNGPADPRAVVWDLYAAIMAAEDVICDCGSDCHSHECRWPRFVKGSGIGYERPWHKRPR